MGHALVRVAQRKVTVRTADEVIAAFADPEVGHVEVSPGTYTWGSVTDVVIHDDRYIRFCGDVLFQNAYIISRAEDNSEIYTGGGTVNWNAGSSRFERSGGSSWSATTGWQIFVRDAWYTRSSSDGDYFYPVEICYADGISGSTDRYVLCKPMQNLHVEGLLRIEHTTGTSMLMLLTGFGVNCNLGNWKIKFEEATSARTNNNGVGVYYSGGITFPQIEILFIEFDCASTSRAFYVVDIQGCVLRNWRASNVLKQDPDNDNVVYGMYITNVDNTRVVDAFMSAVTRMDQDVGTPTAISYYLSSSTTGNLIHGHSIAPYSEYGAESHSSNNGTNNTIDLITVT